jgi:hypothetical protein
MLVEISLKIRMMEKDKMLSKNICFIVEHADGEVLAGLDRTWPRIKYL